MIDIHIIPAPGFTDNFNRTVEALRHPKVNVWVGPYIKGNLLEARYQSYSKGAAELVTWVDDDDAVLDMSWVDDALRVMRDTQVSAVYPRWRASRDGQVVYETPVHEWTFEQQLKSDSRPLAHHFTVMRRKNVMKVLDQAKAEIGAMRKDADRMLLLAQARFGRMVALPQMAYEWKLRNGSARSQQNTAEADQWLRAFNAETVTLAGSRSPQRG